MTARRAVVVPVDYALAFTADRGWHVLTAPTPEWLEEQGALLLEDERAREARRVEAGRTAALAAWSALTADERQERAQRAAQARWPDRSAAAS